MKPEGKITQSLIDLLDHFRMEADFTLLVYGDCLSLVFDEWEVMVWRDLNGNYEVSGDPDLKHGDLLLIFKERDGTEPRQWWKRYVQAH